MTKRETLATQAGLRRTWVALVVMGFFVVGIGFGLYTLGQQAPRIIANSALPSVPPLRGAILAADGTPLALTTTEGERKYPLGVSASQVLGFVERYDFRSGAGLEGLELYLQERLAKGHKVYLTLRPEVQSLAEVALWRAMEKSRADWGTALVMESSTGNLLAVANGPPFDPSALRGKQRATNPWDNHAFFRVLEPGSTIKAFTAAVLLQEGVADLNTKVYAPMSRRVGRETINDVLKHPDSLTLAEVLQFSSNVGISTLADSRLPPKTLYRYFQKLHFEDLDLLPGLPLAVRPLRKSIAQNKVDKATATFGQGFSLSPLHLLTAYNALSNDGTFIYPNLVEDNQGIQVGQAIFSPETARSIRQALTDGVAERARLRGYALGGKTGTSQFFDAATGRYSTSVYSALFAGFVPSDNPRATVLVILHHPKGEELHGSQVAAPAFREIAAGLLALWGETPEGH
jgi:cell division protein FtsI (penicillin-binding protein 3)